MYQPSTTLAVAAALIAFLYWYIIATPWYCSGACCLYKDTCREVAVVGKIMNPKYTSIANALSESLTHGWDLGASVFLSVNGETVLNVAGGFRDMEKTIPYDVETINMIFSSGKIIENIGIAILVDKGLVELDTPIAKHWPEFGKKGKDQITIGDILSHRSGCVSSYEVMPDASVLQDPQRRDEFIASQKFQYERGTVCYRGWSSAFVSDALCRRLDPKQRSLAELVREEVFNPLGEGSSFFCPPVADDWEERLSEVHDIPTPTILLGVLPQVFIPSSFYRTVLGDGHLTLLNDAEVALYDGLINKKGVFSKPTIPDVDDGAASYNNRSSFMSYNMMSANCISNSRALGRALDSFMSGNIVSKETVNLFLEPFPTSYDILLGRNSTYTKGGTYRVSFVSFMPSINPIALTSHLHTPNRIW
jgi:CubicO group peptidase (beta-lactamase class C family)